MGTYYVIGIHTETGTLRQLAGGDTQAEAMEIALQYADNYLRCFLVQPRLNPQELVYTPAVSAPARFTEGDTSPLINEASF